MKSHHADSRLLPDTYLRKRPLSLSPGITDVVQKAPGTYASARKGCSSAFATRLAWDPEIAQISLPPVISTI